MKSMTTVEFSRANLSALADPVQIRRYTKVIGTFYPGEEGQPGLIDMGANATPEQVEALRVDLGVVAPASTKAATKIIEDLTEEVKRLKKELANRPVSFSEPKQFTDARASTTSQGEAVSKRDPFATLPKQDRDFFDRKLGKKK